MNKHVTASIPQGPEFENLITADANVGVAKASFFPTIFLTVALGGVSHNYQNSLVPAKRGALPAI